MHSSTDIGDGCCSGQYTVVKSGQQIHENGAGFFTALYIQGDHFQTTLIPPPDFSSDIQKQHMPSNGIYFK